MKRMPLRAAFLFLVLMATAAWALVAVDGAVTGRLSAPALAGAVAFTAMLVAWPFAIGWRREGRHWVHLQVCCDCGAPRLAGMEFGFCLRCGSTRTAVAQGY